MTYAVPPTVAAAACVVASGSRPARVTRRVAGSKAYTAREAVPFGSDPPAMTTRPFAPVTAA